MHRISLMTWNVRYFGHGTGGLLSTSAWMRKVAGALAEVAPDVAALQEVEQHASLRGGLSETPQIGRFVAQLNAELAARGSPRRYTALYYPAHRYGIGGSPALYTTGLAVLLSEHIEVVHDNAHAPHPITHVRVPALSALKQRRIAAHVRLRPRGASQTLDLFNTHLSLPAFFEGGPHTVHVRMGHGTNQLREVEALLELFRQNAAPERAVVLGDFNSRPGSPAWRAMLQAGFVDAYARHLGLSAAEIEAKSTAKFMNLRMHIDHVFSTPDLRWLELHAHGIDEAGPFYGLSDHSPKIGLIELD